MGSVCLKKNISQRRQYKNPVLWIRIHIDFGRLDPDPGGKNYPEKRETVKKCVVLEVLDVLF
jgi:hypothetical protein